MNDWIETIKLQAAKQAGAIGQARHALVSSVDPVSHAVKVTIQPEGLESGWIPDAAVAAAGLWIACPAEIGTQVLVVPVEGDAEHPVLVARIFDVSSRPGSSPATGHPVQPGEVGIFLKSGVYLHLSGETIFMKGHVVIDGTVTANKDVVAGGVSLSQHLHGGVQAGHDNTAVPEPSNG